MVRLRQGRQGRVAIKISKPLVEYLSLCIWWDSTIALPVNSYRMWFEACVLALQPFFAYTQKTCLRATFRRSSGRRLNPLCRHFNLTKCCAYCSGYGCTPLCLYRYLHDRNSWIRATDIVILLDVTASRCQTAELACFRRSSGKAALPFATCALQLRHAGGRVIPQDVPASTLQTAELACFRRSSGKAALYFAKRAPPSPPRAMGSQTQIYAPHFSPLSVRRAFSQRWW